VQVSSQLQEAETNEIIDDIRSLFELISDKDLFRSHFSNHLSQRLLSGKSTNINAEKKMISKLKEAEGMQFTLQLENMISDFAQSGTMARDHEMRWRNDGASQLIKHSSPQAALLAGINPAQAMGSQVPFEMPVRVLCQAYWPASIIDMSSVNIPACLDAGSKHFIEFYALRRLCRRGISTNLAFVEHQVFRNVHVNATGHHGADSARTLGKLWTKFGRKPSLYWGSSGENEPAIRSCPCVPEAIGRCKELQYPDAKAKPNAA